MKRILMTVAVGSLLFTGCKTSGSLSGTDDVYANPAEEKRLAIAAAEEKARKEALQRRESERAAAAKEEERQKEENSPYYKDPDYNNDDYYDYEYASRLNRFHNPIPGAGYYDPFYTNMYTYNQNPMFWGTSIYSGWGMPSSTFGMYSMGISSGWRMNPYVNVGMSWGTPMCSPWNYGGYYNPQCYSGFYDPWYSPWGYGSSFHSGYNMGFYNGYWAGQYGGYYNSMDPNSGYSKVHYGRRGQSIGGNTPGRRGLETGTESQRRRYMENVAAQQENSPRFTERTSTSRRTYNSSSSGNREQNRSVQPASPEGQRSGRRSESRRTYESGTRRQQAEPRRQQQQRQQPQQRRQEPSNRSGGTFNQTPSNSGNRSGTSPRNTGGSSGRTRTGR